MSSEWLTVEIGSLCSGIYDGPHATPKKTTEGPVFLGISSLNSGQLDLTSLEYLSDEDFAKWTRRVIPRAGDIVFSYETRLGQVALIPEGLRCCLGRRMALMRVNPEKAIPDYLLYAYLGPDFQEVIRQRTIHGSTVDRIPLVEFGSFPISVPPVDVQKEVVATLRSLDDRITLLRETNATLESIAQALFKSWFVNFDPVRAKMEGRAPEGMDEATAALFPDGFEESELGLVPRGWRVGKIGEVCTLGRGSSPRPIQNFMGEDIPWIKIADATASDGMFIFKTKEKIKREGASKSTAVAHGDLIMSNSASCGIPVFVELEGCIHDGWLYFRNFSAVSKILMFYWLRHISAHLVNIADGSVQKNLNIGLVSSQSIICPVRPLLNAFDSLCQPLLDRIRENCLQAQTLATLRDTLLPRLISGQLRVNAVSD
jgi:type I restriction enzyme, S subunit